MSWVSIVSDQTWRQVAPSELEDLIRRHPGVLDVAVVGVPDERVRGRRPTGEIVEFITFYDGLFQPMFY
jgi:acyl-CoA synthetase (AMP-forming)/AMP-acid ligase II